MKFERYTCPDCHQFVEVGVKLVTPPTHKCPRHANKVRVMTPVAEEKPPTE